MATWKIDTENSSATFKIQHRGLAWVRGQMFNIIGEVDFDPENPQNAKFTGELDVTTINTGSAFRDGHLKSPDFFDIKKFPKIIFNSESVTLNQEKKAEVLGDLTIHGVTKKVKLTTEFLGVSEKTNKDGNSSQIAAFSIHTIINREDFGLTWNVDLPGEKLLVGKEVEIWVEIEAIS